MEDIQGSEGSRFAFMTINATTFGPDLLMRPNFHFRHKIGEALL
jgi:hypothetical protein